MLVLERLCVPNVMLDTILVRLEQILRLSVYRVQSARILIQLEPFLHLPVCHMWRKQTVLLVLTHQGGFVDNFQMVFFIARMTPVLEFVAIVALLAVCLHLLAQWSVRHVSSIESWETLIAMHAPRGRILWRTVVNVCHVQLGIIQVMVLLERAKHVQVELFLIQAKVYVNRVHLAPIPILECLHARNVPWERMLTLRLRACVYHVNLGSGLGVQLEYTVHHV